MNNHPLEFEEFVASQIEAVKVIAEELRDTNSYNPYANPEARLIAASNIVVSANQVMLAERLSDAIDALQRNGLNVNTREDKGI